MLRSEVNDTYTNIAATLVWNVEQEQTRQSKKSTESLMTAIKNAYAQQINKCLQYF